jgi:hypothetical protein
MTQAFNLSQLANNLNTSGQLDATDGLTGATPVANGGTGLSTITANNVILGNGTSAVQLVAPSTSGNVLTSNGTTWQSTAPAGGGVTSLNGQTGAIVNTDLFAIGSYGIFGTNLTSNVTIGNTRAGSSLRYGGNLNSSFASLQSRFVGGVTVTPNGSSVSGTWRKMDDSVIFNYDDCGGTIWRFALWTRIS